jgi:LPS export ABC transporter protein LptC
MAPRNPIIHIIKNITSKQIKLLLISVIGITLMIVIGVFTSYRSMLDEPEKLIKALPDGANIVLNRVRHVAKRQGKKEMEVEAVTANYNAAQEKLVLKNLTVTFFLENDTKAYLTANKGILNTESNDIEVLGEVVLKNDHYQLITESLFYNHEARIMKSMNPVKIVGESSTLMADSMSYDLNTDQVLFEGKVSGAFIGSFKM